MMMEEGFSGMFEDEEHFVLGGLQCLQHSSCDIIP